MLSADAVSDLERKGIRARLRAGEMLAARGIYGLVWLDDDLRVRNRFGSIAEFIEVGAPVAHSVPALVGLEEEIKALRADPGGGLRLTDVAIIGRSSASPRFNMFFYAFEAPDRYIMVLSDADAASDIKMNLDRQVRARHLAEAAALARSRQLARTNATLKTANDNLEQFATVITHDLKAPMRALIQMADGIEAAMRDDDAPAARRMLGQLRQQATRMSSMLSALLHYASSGLQCAAVESVDTGALVAEIVRSLPHDGIEISITGPWPVIDTVATPLDLTLRNVIQNTIEHHDRAHGCVVVRCTDAGDALEISIEDDGPGIAPEHQESIFMPFNTVSGVGTSMGLAIVRRMVDAAGGRITVASGAPDARGTIFHIRWPKSQQPLNDGQNNARTT